MNAQSLDLLIQERSEGALSNFEELYRKYQGLVRSVVYRLTPYDQIDDVVQETFYKVWKGLPAFQGNSGLKLWIYQIAYRASIDGLRSRKRGDRNASLNVENPEINDEKRFLNHDLVRHHLAKFSEEHRSVLVFFYLEELSIEEISTVMNIPKGTVKSRLHYAKQALEESLKQEESRL